MYLALFIFSTSIYDRAGFNWFFMWESYHTQKEIWMSVQQDGPFCYFSSKMLTEEELKSTDVLYVFYLMYLTAPHAKEKS